MEAETRPGESSAATADKPGTPAAGAFRMAGVVFFVPLQVLVAWLFVGDWWAHVGDRVDASATVPLLLSGATAAIFLGTVVTELVMLARRRRDAYQVVFTAFLVVNLVRIVESSVLPTLAT